MATVYYKLGKNASIFLCPITKMKVLPGNPGKVSEEDNLRSGKIREASAKGHIVQITEDEADSILNKTLEVVEAAKEKEDEVDYSAFTIKALLAHIEESFVLSEEDLKKLSTYKKAALVEYIQRAEASE